MLVISCHADTGFTRHRLAHADHGVFFGHLDNFAGVYAVMRAFFSGRLPPAGVRIELTEGEEIDMAGARRVAATLQPADLVIVVDVTAAPTAADFAIEKCDDPDLALFLHQALDGLDYELWAGCPDPISESDETDVYAAAGATTCFLGIPVSGGDYNETEVFCREASLAAAAEALVRIAHAHAARWIDE